MNRCRLLAPLIGALFLLSSGSAALAAGIDHRAIARALTEAGDARIAAYDPADGPTTGDAISDIYFGQFEETGLEADIGAIDPALKTELESRFAAVIAAAGRGQPRDKVEAAWGRLRTGVLEAAEARAGAAESGAGAGKAFVQGLLILLREGVEALLVVGALVTYLRRMGAADKLPAVWWGVAAALAASLATAYVMAAVLDASGPAREGLEGATVLAAAAVLAYVSHWLFARREAARWQGYIRDQMTRALSGGQVFSLGLAAFLAVYREGAETALFYQALLASSPGQIGPIFSGFAVAAAVLAGLFVAFNRLSVRLPLGPFFTATAILLYGLAVIFTGQGVLEMLEASWLSATPLDLVPTISALGLFPTAEGVGAQVVLLLALAPVLLALRRRTPEAAR